MSEQQVADKGKAKAKAKQATQAQVTHVAPPALEPGKERPILYPEKLEVRMIGDEALSTKKRDDILDEKNQPQEFGFVGRLLGLTYDEAYAKECGAEAPTFIDRNKKPVFCLNNLTNRPVNFGKVEDLVQEIKFSGPKRKPEDRRWRYNSETMIVSKTGLIQNGQKQLIACCLAEQDRTGPQKMAWEYLGWDRPVQIDKLLTFGNEDDDKLIDTLDQVQPRSLADVIYRSEHFARFKPEQRKVVSRMADYAIRLMWDRTGAGYRPKKGAGVATTAPRRTTPEAMDFLRRHPRLLDAIKVIYERYGKDDLLKTNKELLSPGYASAMLYLMGTSATDGDRNGLGQVIAYADAEPAPNESALDFTLWDGAAEFWTCLCRMPTDGDAVCPQFREVLNTIAALEPPMGSARPALVDRLAVLALAWQRFSVGDEFKRVELTPEWVYKKDSEGNYTDSGRKILKEPYSCGGIDLGHSPGMTEEEGSAPVEQREDSTVPDTDEPTPEQQATIQAEKAKIDKERLDHTMAKLRESAERKRQEQERLKAQQPVQTTQV